MVVNESRMQSTRVIGEQSVVRKLGEISRLVGHTPLLEIQYVYCGSPGTVYAKYEQTNLTGSIKDRVALEILRSAYATDEIKEEHLIAEATSGNMGISIAAIGGAIGHPVRIYMPDWMSLERVKIIESYGAEVILVSHGEGGFLGCIRRTQELAAERNDVFLPCQFSNQANVRAHFNGTGPEIWQQMLSHGRTPDAFVAGVGTGGTIMGAGAYLQTENPSLRAYPVEPAESPTLSAGHRVGSHRIQGISDEFIPEIVRLHELERPIAISDGDSILMAQKLASVLGLGVGISSGCNFLAAVRAQQTLGADAVVATVFPDDNKKYLTTDLTREQTQREDHLSPKIQLKSLKVRDRVSRAIFVS